MEGHKIWERGTEIYTSSRCAWRDHVLKCHVWETRDTFGDRETDTRSETQIKRLITKLLYRSSQFSATQDKRAVLHWKWLCVFAVWYCPCPTVPYLSTRGPHTLCYLSSCVYVCADFIGCVLTRMTQSWQHIFLRRNDLDCWLNKTTNVKLSHRTLGSPFFLSGGDLRLRLRLGRRAFFPGGRQKTYVASQKPTWRDHPFLKRQTASQLWPGTTSLIQRDCTTLLQAHVRGVALWPVWEDGGEEPGFLPLDSSRHYVTGEKSCA